MRFAEKLFEQNQIINDITDRISSFDHELLELENTKLDIELQTKFMQLYYLTIYQELIILRDFEKPQKLLLEDIDNALYEKNDIEQKILNENHNLRLHEEKLKLLYDEANSIERSFEGCCSNSEFSSDFELIFRADELLETSQMNEKMSTCPILEQIQSLRFQRIELETQIKNETSLINSSKSAIYSFSQKLTLIERDLQANEYGLNMLLVSINNNN